MSLSARWLAAIRVFERVGRALPALGHGGDVDVRDAHVPGTPRVRVRVYRPRASSPNAPALLWIHGGGMVMGAPEFDDALCAANARDLGILVVSVDYRLAPEHPFPAPLDDCDTALRWLFAESAALGVDRARIAVGGLSAGGGLTAALVQRTCDRGEVRPVFQVLLYPMLDDRTAARTDVDDTHHRAWNHPSNVFGWTSYLAQPPGAATTPDYAAPARRADLSGLPPAWVGVGTRDLFYEEDVAYARRLQSSGVPCELSVVEGAFHAFDRIVPGAPVSREFRASYLAALRRAFAPLTT